MYYGAARVDKRPAIESRDNLNSRAENPVHGASRLCHFITKKERKMKKEIKIDCTECDEDLGFFNQHEGITETIKCPYCEHVNVIENVKFLRGRTVGEL